MISGAILEQETAKASNNVLSEFCNFNKLKVWNKTSGGGNANVINDISGRRSYFGLGCVSINFTGTGQVAFNSGDSSMERVIQRTGNYLLSYAFSKTDNDSDITFIVEMYVNAVLQSSNTITQQLVNANGFIDNQYNAYFQNVYLEYGDVVDFAFKAQSDTTACYLYFDRLKLEIDDKGNGFPTIYTEAPLDVIEEENTLTLGLIPAGETIEVTASLAGCNRTDSDRRNVTLTYPEELFDLGLVVSLPVVYANDVVKFLVYNPTGADITPTPDSIYNLKIIR